MRRRSPAASLARAALRGAGIMPPRRRRAGRGFLRAGNLGWYALAALIVFGLSQLERADLASLLTEPAGTSAAAPGPQAPAEPVKASGVNSRQAPESAARPLAPVVVPFEVPVQPAAADAPAQRGDVIIGQVTRFVDGDTFWMENAPVRIRVWGLDAPELSDPGGDAATEALRRIVANQPLSCLVRDIDRFGRIVGQCFLPDGRDITAEMIRSGTATEFCRFSRNHYGTCR